MNFDDAISAHIKWKVRLGQFIEGIAKEPLDSATVCKDNVCDLGKWIYGEGARFKTLASYAAVVKAHARFHVEAGAVVRQVEGGDPAGARAAMGGAFAIASKETVAAILGLKREATSDLSALMRGGRDSVAIQGSCPLPRSSC